MDQVDLYKALGVDRKCTNVEIKKAYKRLVVKYHPDRGGDSEIFEIISNAYNILVNDDTRQQYDELYKLNQETNVGYKSMRKQAQSFLESQNTKASDTDYSDFKIGWEELNKKHGYQEENENEMVIPTEIANLKWSELQNKRETQYNEDKPEQIFPDLDNFDLSKFNAAYDAANGSIHDIVQKKDVPDAWNCSSEMTGYSAFSKLDEIYDEHTDVNDLQNVNYGSVNFNKQSKKITKDDVKNMAPADYYKNHNKLENNYKDIIKQRLKERNFDSKKFSDKKFNNYEKDNTAGYGIFEKLGIKYNDRLSISDWSGNDVNSAYQKLLNDRQSLQ